MQGLNFNYNSTYIQNTIQNDSSSQTKIISENSENAVSFLQMVNSARDDIAKLNNDDFSESAKETDKEVTKTFETQKSEQESQSDFKSEEVSTNDKEVKSVEKVSEKDEINSKKTESTDYVASEFIAKLLNQDVQNQSESKQKNRTEKKVTSNFQDAKEISLLKERISLLKGKVDDEKLKGILNNIKDLKNENSKNFENELIAEQFIFDEDIKKSFDNLDLSKNLFKDENHFENVKEIKLKKTEKKLSDVISISDLRTEKIETAQKKSQLTTTIKQTSNNSVTVNMDLSNQAEKNILSLDSQTASSQGSNFQAMLENQIFENSADFVKAGKIVLKDNNFGNIELVLHPESLGNVKISLELSDKIITGKILVSSQEALEAFKATQNNLKTAFIEGGFDSASFDVSFANQNSDFSSGNQNQENSFRQAEKVYGNYLVENSLVEELNSDIYNDGREYSLNVVA